MRHFKGKQILSLVREGDYAHQGEEEAIYRVMDNIPKDDQRLILDVACGLGGTAKFIQDHGWGQVTGIDIEKESIEYASKTYPEVKFEVCDVVEVPKVINEKFDLICIFGSFLLFEDQPAALKALRAVAHDKTKLILLDYINRNNYVHPTLSFNALKFPNFNEMLLSYNWQLSAVENIDEDQIRWYLDLINRITAKRNEIIERFGEEAYRIVYQKYSYLLKGMQERKLGGGIVRAIPISEQ